jgi:glycosyltransferase involved in cell wall biosynthesis
LNNRKRIDTKQSHDRVVPKYETVEFRSKQSDYVLIVFVINEGEKIKKQIRNMKKYSSIIDIVIADGGSTDGSLDSSYVKKHDIRAVLTKKDNGKLSAQMRMAFSWALDQGYKGVVVVDGNGKDDISAIPDFIKLLYDGYDHVQGSRYIPGGHAINTPFMRHWALKLLHAPLISIASHTKQTDTTNGFRAYSAQLLSDKNISIFRDIFQTYELHYYLAIESGRRKEFKTIETPVTRTYPKKGKTPTKISPVKGNIHVLGVLFKAVFGKYKTPKD